MSESHIRMLGIAPYRFLPAVNGGHKAIEQLYKNVGALAPTLVVSTKNNESDSIKQYELVRLFANNPLHYINVFYFFKIKSLIKERNITHVIIEHPYMSWLGFLLQRYAGVRYTIRSHNIEAIRFKTLGKGWWRAMWQYERWAHRKADMSFFITEEDRQFAIQHYQLSAQKTAVLTYGVDEEAIPSAEAKQAARKMICAQYHIPSSHTLLLFNGDLGYAPNTQAVEAIVQYILPLLLQHFSFVFTLLICGRNLPEEYAAQVRQQSAQVIYTGYVDDIVPYFLATDIFINPVVAGGGIKTKLVEALAYNCSVVSCASGAKGLSRSTTGNKMEIAEDGDWQTFAKAIVESDVTLTTPAAFYNHFYWGNIAKRALEALKRT